MFLTHIDALDKQLFHFLNDLHSPFWDTFMQMMSNKWLHLSFGLLILGYLSRTQAHKKLLLWIFCAAIAVGMADMTSARICKPFFQRVRPCHAELSFEVHTVNGQCGGQYGFVSSHAANLFAAAFMLALFFTATPARISLFLGAGLVAYSRIYLGVHYPADVLFGAILGMAMGQLGWKLFYFCEQKYL